LIDHSQHVTQPPDNQKNFLVVDAKTETAQIEAAFDRFTSERKDIAILLINQHVRWVFC
jgi:V-type H+-transporting ATPase subunit F